MSEWKKQAEENEPMQDGRYAIIYQQGATVRRFIGDYSVVDGWLGMMDAEVIAWAPLPGIPKWVIDKYSKQQKQEA